MEYRADIQIMRAIAVVVVVLFHLNFLVFKNGFLGVDVFFVISGFLMAVLYKRGQVKNFYQRRARRLLPAYFATIFITLLISLAFVVSIDHKQVVEQSIWGVFFASNIGFWNQASYFSSKYFNPLLHLWSLGVEIQFYILVPFVFWLFYKNKNTLILIAALSLVLSMVALKVNAKTAFFITPFRMYQFLAGSIIALYFTRQGAIKFFKPYWGLLALVAILSLILFYPVDVRSDRVINGHPGLASILVTFFTALTLIFGLPKRFEVSFLGGRLARLGDWSYSIYLAHFPVVVFYLYKPLDGTNLKSDSFLDLALMMVLIFALSFILYMFFDRKRWRVNLKTSLYAIASIISFAVVSSYFVSFKNSELENNILNSYEDRDAFRCGRFYRVMDEMNFSNYFACELTDDSARNYEPVLLLGDSTADAIKSSFTKVAQENNFKVFTTASNRAASGHLSAEKIIQETGRLKIKIVVVHFHSSFMDTVFSLNLYEKLIAAGLEVLWIAPIPVFPDAVPKIIYEMQNEKFTSFKPSNHKEVIEIANDLKGKGVKVFNPWELLCEIDLCMISNEEGNAYYHDSLHMSLTGAKQLEPLFEEIFYYLSRHN